MQQPYQFGNFSSPGITVSIIDITTNSLVNDDDLSIVVLKGVRACIVDLSIVVRHPIANLSLMILYLLLSCLCFCIVLCVCISGMMGST